MVKTDLTITAVSEEDIKDFFQLCMFIQEAGIRGTGLNLPVFVDGDGSGRYTFHYAGEELPRVEEGLDLNNLNTINLGE